MTSMGARTARVGVLLLLLFIVGVPVPAVALQPAHAAQAGEPAHHTPGGEVNIKLPSLEQGSFLGFNGHQILLSGLLVCVLGLLFGSTLKAHLFNATTVATAFIVGGFLILWAEKRQHVVRVHTVEEMTTLDALKVGIAQAFALVPGTSRSGATIIGGLLFGLSRQVATEFTFYLAIPTLGLASLYSLYDQRELLVVDDIGMWVVGMVAAFLSAFVCVRWLIRYVSTHTFIPFAWYRIAFGIVVLATAWTGTVAWSG